MACNELYKMSDVEDVFLDTILELSLEEEDVMQAVSRQALCELVQKAQLDRLQLATLHTGALSRLPNLRALHLQHNLLTALPELHRVSPSLRFLSVAHNKLTALPPGLSGLTALFTLDASHNAIADCSCENVPTSLRYLNVSGNPCSTSAAWPETRDGLLHALPNLRELSGESLFSEASCSDASEAPSSASHDICGAQSSETSETVPDAARGHVTASSEAMDASSSHTAASPLEDTDAAGKPAAALPTDAVDESGAVAGGTPGTTSALLRRENVQEQVARMLQEVKSNMQSIKAQHQAAVQQQRDLRESSSTLAEPLPSAAAARGGPPCEAGRTDDSSGAISRTPESHASSAAVGADNRGGTPAQGRAEPQHGGVECSTAQLAKAENREAGQSRGNTAEGGAAATAAGSAGRLQSARERGGAARAQLHQVTAAIERLRTRDDPLQKLPQPRGEARAAFQLRAAEGGVERAARLLAASRPATAADGVCSPERADGGAADADLEQEIPLATRANALPSLTGSPGTALQNAASGATEATGFQGFSSLQLPDDPLAH